MVQFLLGGLVVGSIYGLVGIGYTGVYNVTRIVNFAQGDFAMIGAVAATVFLELGWPLAASIAAGIAATLMLALSLFFGRTYPGKAFRACAVNPYAAVLCAVDVRAMAVVSFVLSGALGAIAGIIVAPLVLVQYDTGIP